MTIWWEVEPEAVHTSHPAIKEAAAVIVAGGTVAFPTETVYGLGADARNTVAVERIFEAKGRPSDNPLIVHIGEKSQLKELTPSIDGAIRRLVDAFWPGPLTIVVPAKRDAVSSRVTAGLSTVAVRMPDHPVALSLLRAAQCPIAAPSANRSGRPSPTKADHVRADLDGLIDGCIDGGSSGVGLESTVVELASDGLYILRPGGITETQIKDVLPQIAILTPNLRGPIESTSPKSPGIKYTHYAPRGSLTLIYGSEQAEIRRFIQERIDKAKTEGEITGIFTYSEHAAQYTADLVVACGSLAHPHRIANELYDALRRFDDAGVTFILAESCPTDGIGSAIMNRLRKAAGDKIRYV